MANRLGMGPQCNWHGHIPRELAIARVAKSHVFIITSVKDLTSTVALEALSQGLPVICIDHCGFRDLITDECGIRVPLGSPSEIYSAFAAAIERLYRNEKVRRAMGRSALIRAEEHSWKRKALLIDNVYRRAVQRGYDRCLCPE